VSGGSPSIGQKVTHYRVLSEIGRGGMGVVYLAEDETLDRKVALKFIRTDLIGGETAEERLMREARAASGLDHPHIGTIYEVGEWQGHHFIAMAYYEGETLAARVERGPLGIAEACRVIEQIAEALARAHASGIVHRDLKPANVFLVPRDAPRRAGSGSGPAATADSSGSGVIAKLLDFGLARQASEELTGATRLTVPGTTVGTVAYMSPEQARGEDVEASADLWALGVIAFELVAGRRPFLGAHAASVLHAILYEPAPELRSLRPEVPERLQAIVRKALAKDKQARHQTADELLADLRAATAGETRQNAASRLRTPKVVLPLAAALVLAAIFGARLVGQARERAWARQALPEVARLAEAEQFVEAFALAERAEKALPHDPMLGRLWPVISRTPAVRSQPPGATVSYKDYGAPAGTWVVAGVTPLKGVRVPAAYLRWRYEKPGFRTLEAAGASGLLSVSRAMPSWPEVLLETVEAAKPGLLLVPGSDEPNRLSLPGFDHLQLVPLRDPFWLQQYEVTNEEFKAFVDADGYRKREYWLEPFEEGGHRLTWEQAIARFHDATGRPGPATWVQGEFPAGENRFPVGGVSWYEAAAYARFVGMRLPTIHHWNRAAGLRTSSWVVPRANFSGKGPVPVGSRDALHPWGHQDLAGNVKEWVSTATVDGRRYILGGGWDEPSYMFNEPDARSPFARTADSGFRCARYLPEPAPELLAPLAWSARDYQQERPAPEPVFEIYRRLYAYDRAPFQASVEASEDGDEHYRREQVSVPTAYGPQRMKIFLYLPKKAAAPFPAVVYFPGATMLRTRSFDGLPVSQFDFIVKSGRAVALPVYEGTFDRPSDITDSTANASASYRDHVIAWVKDFMRAVDYLETRPDLALDRLALVGLSWGARMGSVIPALDERVKLEVLIVGGFSMQRPMPEVDQINFASRVRVPVLMLNGRYDFFFPVDASQRPMFETLGTPKADKRHLLYDTGHGIPRVETIKETLAWLDRYQPVPAPGASRP
jgi:dienelactone hydrolase/tRNA A-37 threonylcarbamoyl transferase component Bud32